MLSPLRRRRLIGFLAVTCVLAVSACDGATSEDPSDSAADPPAQMLAYGFEAGQQFTYEVALDQNIVLKSEGASDTVDDSEVPGSADISIAATGVLTFDVAAGPDEGTYAVTVEGSFDDPVISGTADGEPVDDAEDIAGLGAIQPVSTELVVDASGRILEDSAAPTAALELGATPLAGLSGDLGRLVGPILPTDPVAVGDTWTETTTDLGLGDEPVETVLEALLSGNDTIDDAEVVVIDAVANTGAAVIDLADFFSEFLGAFADPDDPEAQAELEATIAQLVFQITIDPSSTESTTWFDPALGLARRSTVTGSPTTFRMEVTLPDEETGDLQSYTMRLEVTQSLDYTLVSPG